MNIDPLWVRLIFFIFILPGGFGFLLYILGCIFIPKSYDAVYNNKRLFRNIDDKIIAGVCSGLAAYFNTKSIYFRLLFLSPLIIGTIYAFPFAAHSAHLIFNFPFIGTYLLLIFLMPKAITTSQKLQMRGDDVNVNTIRNQVYGNTTLPSQQVYNSSFSTFIGFIIKALFYCIIGFILFIIVTVSIGLFSSGGVIMHFSDYLFRPGHQTFLANFGWILFFGTPIAFVILLIVNKFNAYKYSNQWYAYFGLAWLFGLFCLFALGKDFHSDFKLESEKPALNIAFNQYPYTTMRLKLMPSKTNDDDFIKSSNYFHLYKDSAVIGNISLQILPSSDSFFHINTSNYTHGKNENELNESINKMRFEPVLIDSTLFLPIGIILKKGQLWRGQKNYM